MTNRAVAVGASGGHWPQEHDLVRDLQEADVALDGVDGDAELSRDFGRPGSLARRMNRGEIWLYTFKPLDKRRPVLVLSRPDVIPLLSTVMVAPITSTIRGAPSEVVVEIDEGLKTESAVNLDHVQTVAQEALRHFIGSLSRAKMTAVCRRLAIAVACDPHAP